LSETVPGAITREWWLSESISRPDELRQSLKHLQANPDAPAALNSEIAYASSMQYYLAMYRNQAENLLDLLNQK
jgi:hypothetical protein